jgi:hypothetical protein
VRCCFSIETWIDFKVNKREIWYMYDICIDIDIQSVSMKIAYIKYL